MTLKAKDDTEGYKDIYIRCKVSARVSHTLKTVQKSKKTENKTL